MRKLRLPLFLALAMHLVLAPPGMAQVRAPQVSMADAALLLRQLDGEKRVLMIAAHPDDEDTSLLATLALGMGARTAYLSLSRGEGGQNLIGPEMAEGLGIIRSGELLSARSLDGAEQFFTRAFDFGFSKSAEETFSLWPREELLRDVVWVVRSFRPHVIVSVFSGTERDGHGQHQAAGIMAHRAFEESGDPSRFADQLALGVDPWVPEKLYRLVRQAPELATLAVETGTLDPLLGRSHHQVAMASRSRHRSQDMGTAETPGPRQSVLEVVATRTPSGGLAEDRLFAGVDTTMAGMAMWAGGGPGGGVTPALERYRAALRRGEEALRPSQGARAVPFLLEAVDALETARLEAERLPPTPRRAELLDALERRASILTDAVLAAAGIWVEVRVDRSRLIPGEGAALEILVWNGGSAAISVGSVLPRLPEGWTAAGDPGPLDTATLAPGEQGRWSFRLAVPAGAQPTRPYFLREARNGALYRWPDDSGLWALPFDPALLRAGVEIRMEGGPALSLVRPAVHLAVDKAEGEFRVPVEVMPPLSVAVDPGMLAWPVEPSGSRSVTVRVRNLGSTARSAEVVLSGGEEWQVLPDRIEVQVAGGGGESTATFEVSPGNPAQEGRSTLHAVVHADGVEYREGVTVIDYPHLNPVPFYLPAETRLSRFPVRVREGVRVGYLMGPGDAGIEALRDLGVDVEAIEGEMLRSGDLDRFDTIVLGIRAYETRTDLIESNARVLDFANRGGTVIVQYNKYEYPEGGFAPFPLDMRRPHDRVTDPDAPVTLLDPQHPVLSQPNRIDASDFEGWTQERGLYFLSEWDERYTPLLEMADPGDDANRGSLVVARVGEGAYVYTGLALFRQLPAGVPGAYRILANLVSLRGSDF